MTGWKLTPREPDQAMMDDRGAYCDRVYASGNAPTARGAWTAMSDAAPSPPEDVLERMARAYDTALGDDEYWIGADEADSSMAAAYDRFKKGRIKAMRAALTAAEERGEQASTSPPSEDER